MSHGFGLVLRLQQPKGRWGESGWKGGGEVCLRLEESTSLLLGRASRNPKLNLLTLNIKGARILELTIRACACPAL